MAEMLGAGLNAALIRMIGEAQTADAVRERSHRYWVREQQGTASTLLGVLTNLAETATVVRLLFGSTTMLRCQILNVGADFVVAIDEKGIEFVVPDAMIRRIETESGRLPDGVDRQRSDVDLRSFLRMLSEDRPDIAVRHDTESVTVGQLERVASDHLVLRQQHSDYRRALIPFGAVQHIATRQRLT